MSYALSKISPYLYFGKKRAVGKQNRGSEIYSLDSWNRSWFPRSIREISRICVAFKSRFVKSQGHPWLFKVNPWISKSPVPSQGQPVKILRSSVAFHGDTTVWSWNPEVNHEFHCSGIFQKVFEISFSILSSMPFRLTFMICSLKAST